jgi:hypothetical protein
MSEAEVDAYRLRLTDAVAGWMEEIESRTGERFSLAIAHHAFTNTVVLRDVNRRRVAAGLPRMTLLCLAHGTELKMFNSERRGDAPEEFPLRFLPFMKRERIFDFADPAHGIDVAARRRGSACVEEACHGHEARLRLRRRWGWRSSVRSPCRRAWRAQPAQARSSRRTWCPTSRALPP